MIDRAGADRVLTLDLHAGQIQGFFDIPTDNLFAVPVMVRDIKELFDHPTISWWSRPTSAAWCAPAALAKRIDAPLAIVDKRRERPGESEVMNIIGDVDGPQLHPGRRHRRFRRHAVQRRRGAARQRRDARSGYITHGVLSGGAVARITGLAAEGAGDHRLDPAERGGARTRRNIRVLPIAPLLGEAIARTAEEQSVSSLFY